MFLAEMANLFGWLCREQGPTGADSSNSDKRTGLFTFRFRRARRRHSFNRDRRVSFPEMHANSNGPVGENHGASATVPGSSSVAVSNATDEPEQRGGLCAKLFCCCLPALLHRSCERPQLSQNQHEGEVSSCVSSRDTTMTTMTPSKRDTSTNMLQLNACALSKAQEDNVQSPLPSPSPSSPKHIIEHCNSSNINNFRLLMKPKAKIGQAVAVQAQPEVSQAAVHVSTRRLMKEVQVLLKKQQNDPKRKFSIDLINDSLYEWYIRIHEFDCASQINRDMQLYGVRYVQLHATFPETYPFDPPFIRVVAPYIERGYVMEGGAICLELLTKSGWTSAYSMEAVIVQLMASFVKGQATIRPGKDIGKCFNHKNAINSFRHIVRIHDKHGWVDTPLYEG